MAILEFLRATCKLRLEVSCLVGANCPLCPLVEIGDVLHGLKLLEKTGLKILISRWQGKRSLIDSNSDLIKSCKYAFILKVRIKIFAEGRYNTMNRFNKNAYLQHNFK